MKKTILTLAAAIGLFACQSQKSKVSETETSKNMEISNKEKVVALLTSLETGDQKPVSYINPNKYIQHNLAVEDGLAGFGKVIANAPEGGFKANVVRAFQDGDFVVTHTEYDFFGPQIGFDIFRFEDGLIVEHWDNLQEVAVETASGRSQTDGPTKIKDLNKTAANKELIKGFVKDVLMGENPAKVTDYISTESYAQHNPAVADGLEGLGAAIQGMADAGTPMVYTKNHFLFGEGDFVFTASEGQFLGKLTAFYDLFRIEDGKIVEHWDTVEEIPAKETWANQNGKF
ncbi:nuclear transport factor 2 family protein [Reichenbachiella versicolor]|uniref:nuclear transport factor 2 family protein n=1 Tax=Reichenbachiella versicolor TaxID=1821036 RepID=UPI000D6DEE9C|nr:nuclear transport factor 2 family protein [Reichenbachiella versicolor]